MPKGNWILYHKQRLICISRLTGYNYYSRHASETVIKGVMTITACKATPSTSSTRTSSPPSSVLLLAAMPKALQRSQHYSLQL